MNIRLDGYTTRSTVSLMIPGGSTNEWKPDGERHEDINIKLRR
jgi:hypothetical protein